MHPNENRDEARNDKDIEATLDEQRISDKASLLDGYLAHLAARVPDQRLIEYSRKDENCKEGDDDGQNRH